MPFARTVFDDGLTVITESMPWVCSISLGMWFGVGSRDETKDQAGLSHFMEHMMFKGTATRNALEVSEAFDALGAESNAFTAKEYTCYYARFAQHRLDDVLDVLSDMVLNSSFRDEDIRTEREVVVEEIVDSEDMPDDHVFEMFMDALYPTHPIGRPVLGTQELVSAYCHEDCRRFRDAHYHSGNLVVSAAGNLKHDEVVQKVRKSLQGLREGQRNNRERIVEDSRERLIVQQREIEQAHLVYGFPWYAAGSDERFAGSMLAAILGGSMSSRLFQEVREKSGLAYSVLAEANAYSDVGEFYVYCATRPDKLGNAAAIIRRELARIADSAPTQEEVRRSCEVICSQLLLGQESTGERMNRLGRREVMGLAQVEVPDLVELYRAVTPEQVRATAERYLTADATAAVISPFHEDAVRKLVFGL